MIYEEEEPSGDELTFAQSVREAVISLFQKGNTDPTVEQILDEYFDQPIVPGIASEVRERLPYICGLVREEYPRVHLVSETYYETYQDNLPQDIGTGARCLPLGTGRVGVGIRLPTVEDDSIYLAYARQNLLAAAGKAEGNLETLNAAYEAGEITAESLIDLVRKHEDLIQILEDIKNSLERNNALKGPLWERLPV